MNVGITACIMPPDDTRSTFSKKSLFYVESDMLHYVSRADNTPMLIPSFNNKKDLHRFIDQLDAVVVQGGVDLCPETYGEPYLDKDKWPGDKIRDDYELSVIDYAFKNKIPIFGICRGFQLLNAYFGGTLYQDIDTEMASPVVHMNRPIYDKNNHAIKFLDDSLLATEIYHDISNTQQVNSIHHQTIKNLGNKLIVEAICPIDNIVEAFRYDSDEQFVYGVQWHPEFNHTLQDTVIDAEVFLDYFFAQVK